MTKQKWLTVAVRLRWPPKIPACWYSHLCVISSPWLQARLAMLLINRIRQRWWDINSVVKTHKTVTSVLAHALPCWPWWVLWMGKGREVQWWVRGGEFLRMCIIVCSRLTIERSPEWMMSWLSASQRDKWLVKWKSSFTYIFFFSFFSQNSEARFFKCLLVGLVFQLWISPNFYILPPQKGLSTIFPLLFGQNVIQTC